MLSIAIRVIEIAILAHIAYWSVTALFGWAQPHPAAAGTRMRRFRVVIPAHDEAHVIPGLLADLKEQDYPPTLVTTWVIADRCRDTTAAIAASAGAAVDVRSDGPGGKGPALAWHLERHPLGEDETLIVMDADNRVPSALLGRFADELDAGSSVLQAYLDVTNPDESPLATAGALSYWASNRMIQQARRRLGWSADLGGTGMAMTAPALARAGGFGGSLTEDADLGVRLTLAGQRVDWVHDLRVGDEKPAGVAATVGQRARWAAGKRTTARRHLQPLLAAAWRERSLGHLDLALRLIQPGRTLVAMLSGVTALVALVWAPSWLLPAPWWIAATAVQVLLPIPFLIRDRVPARYVLRYPMLLLLAGLALPIRLASRLGRGWYHTRHRGTTGATVGAPGRDP